jgi:hypothetical protein
VVRYQELNSTDASSGSTRRAGLRDIKGAALG